MAEWAYMSMGSMWGYKWECMLIPSQLSQSLGFRFLVVEKTLEEKC
jgi:hypothetical protein